MKVGCKVSWREPNWGALEGYVTGISASSIGGDRMLSVVRLGQHFELLESEVEVLPEVDSVLIELLALANATGAKILARQVESNGN